MLGQVDTDWRNKPHRCRKNEIKATFFRMCERVYVAGVQGNERKMG